VQDAVGARSVETKTRVFISYSRKDMAFADRLESALNGRGFEVLIDRQEIYAFEDWWKRIQALIGQSDAVVFALSPDSVKSDVALKEVAHAASLNKRFAPIVCHRVDDAAVPDMLRRLNFIFFDEPEQFEASADRLAEALQTDIAWVRRHTEFGDTAHRWVEAGRPGGMLLRPPVLDQAEAWLAFRPGGAPAPTAEAEAFIAQSRKAMLGTQRLRRIALGSIIALMMAVILGLVGIIKQDFLKAQWRYWTVTWPYERANIWPYVLGTAKEQALKPGQSFKECRQDCPEMIVVPAGSFLMGSSPTEKGRFAAEGPQHTVTIGKPFAVSKFEITFDEWDTCAAYGDCAQGVSDAGWGRGQRPTIYMSWDDAQQYVAWLSKMTGKTYRLLTEAEYEYAARAGTQTVYPWGDELGTNNTNCEGCGSRWDNTQTAPAGSFAANGFGLYDMEGNVWEWVEDCYHPAYEIDTPQGKIDAPTDGSAWITGGDCSRRVDRAGAYDYGPSGVRSAYRDRDTIGIHTLHLGFRVARTLLAP
jgi:formylglycine-generating enzyme required for sulfatase activity